MFIGRERELKTLGDHYRQGGFGFFCLYGRRRVGKTELIREFIKDKKAIFFTGVEDTKEANLAAFSHAVRDALHNARGRVVYADFQEAFADIYEAAKKEKITLVIDEYPYLASSYPGISSLLQVEIDHRLKDTNLFVILCGSSMSFMERQVMGHKSPLYGRRTGQIKVLPFDYETSALFFPQRKAEDKALIYGLTGGIARYLPLFSNNKKLDDNIADHFFHSSGLLFEEPANLLKQELREPALYNSIIAAVAGGGSRVNAISQKTHLDSSTCVKYLDNLLDLGIIKREIPLLEKENSRKSIYRLNDGMLRFWYRFVYSNISKIQIGRGRQAYDEIKQYLPDYMGEAFEAICLEYMWKAALPFSVSQVGRWWGNNPQRKCEQEIDLLAVDSDKNKAVFCECKWRNEKMPASTIDELVDKAAMFTNFAEKYYYFFSKSGFTEAAKNKASDRVVLLDFADMY